MQQAVAQPAFTGGAGEFLFLDPGALIDRELELVAPGPPWVEDLLASSQHPLTRSAAPEQALTRQQIMDFLKAAPMGREPGGTKGRAPSYHFWMRLRPQFAPAVPMAGSVGLRVGSGREVELYFGHIGYNVFPPARGHHYAERGARLLLGLARRHGMSTLWITTDPDNYPSRRTCERLGAVLVEIVEIPPGNLLYERGQRRKCRYRLELGNYFVR